jgi:hypothetical protein
VEGRIPPRGSDTRDYSGRIDRGYNGNPNRDGGLRRDVTPAAPDPHTPATIDRGIPDRWRDRIDRPTPSAPTERPAPDYRDRTPAVERPQDQPWRGRVVGRGGDAPRDITPRDNAPDAPPADRGSDVPRRIIDRIGGARIYGDTPHQSSPHDSSPPPRIERSSPPPERSSPPPERSSPPPERSSPPPESRGHEEGHIKRDQ